MRLKDGLPIQPDGRTSLLLVMIQTLHIPPPLPLTPHYFRVDGLAKQRRLWRKMRVTDKSDGTRGITFSAVTSDRWEMKLRITNGDDIVDVIAKRPSEREYAPDRQYASIWTRYVLQAAAMFVDTSMCTQFSREFFMPQLLQSRNPSNPPYMFAAKAAESKADVFGRSRQHCCALQAAMILS